MNCPRCGAESMLVSLTRLDADAVWRKRVCRSCKEAVTTVEMYSKTALDAPMPPHRLNRKAKK